MKIKEVIGCTVCACILAFIGSVILIDTALRETLRAILPHDR